jgi:hypothetical protein
MPKLAQGLLSLIIVVAIGTAQAEEPQKEWLDFLEGDWTIEWSTAGITAEIANRSAAGGTALLSQHKSDNGDSVELIAWRADKKVLVFSGYGAKGNYWHAEYRKLTQREIKGSVHGVLPDGRPFSGSVSMKRVDDGNAEIVFKGKAADDEYVDEAKLCRKGS